MNEILAAAVWITGVAGAVGIIWKAYCKVRNKINDILEAFRCQLRSEMLRTYYRHKDDKRIRQYERENFEHNFKAYTALGGNSFIGDVYEEVCEWEVVT